MYSDVLDVDNFVFTYEYLFVKILLYAEKYYIYSPLIFIMFGTICIFKIQSAGNFDFSTKVTAVTKNTYTKCKNLPLISKHVFLHKSNLTNEW